ncbi:MAG: type II toxin-antitoxin system VapC family toxin [Acidobacteriota bacterium]
MILYLETSNLVKLYVQESDSDEILRLVREAEAVATSIVAYVEARAAFARKFRDRGISEKDYQTVKKAFLSDWENVFVIRLTDAVAKSAGDLAEKRSLRGFDALHLASAVQLLKSVRLPVVFSSSDARLSEAAKKEGLH